MRMFRSVRHRLHGWCGFDRARHRVVGARPAATMRRRAHATVSASDSPPPRQRSDDITTWETRGTPARGLLQATGTSRSHGDESTTTTTRRTYALEQGDAHRAVALVATIQLPMDAELTHVVAASMTIAVAREGETTGEDDGGADAVCSLVLDVTNSGEVPSGRWRVSPPSVVVDGVGAVACTATRVGDGDGALRGDVDARLLRVEASLPRAEAVRAMTVTSTYTAKKTSSASSIPLQYVLPFDVAAVSVVTKEDIDGLAWAWLARAARCRADSVPAVTDACAENFFAKNFPSGASTLPVSAGYKLQANLDGCCDATAAYHVDECACALDVFSPAQTAYGQLDVNEEVGYADDTHGGLRFPSRAAADDERRLLSSLRRLCDFDAATDVVTGDLEGASPSVRVGSIDSCVDSSVIMSEVATAARTALTRGGGGEDAEDDEDLAAQSSKTNVEEEPTTPRLFTDDDASIDAGDLTAFLSWLDAGVDEADALSYGQTVSVRSTTSVSVPPPTPFFSSPPPRPPSIPPSVSVLTQAVEAGNGSSDVPTAGDAPRERWEPDSAFFSIVVVILVIAGLLGAVLCAVCVRRYNRWKARVYGDDDGEDDGVDGLRVGGELLLVRRRATPHPGIGVA